MNVAKRQRGLSFGGFMLGALILVLGSITGFRLIPAYIENTTIKNIFNIVAKDPELQKASEQEIRMAYIKRAMIDNVTAIKAEDVEIATDDGQLVLSASYSVTVKLAANISLVMDFKPKSGD
ncbi:MAG: DUF4845 domain-containing protein [Gallionella sp.]